LLHKLRGLANTLIGLKKSEFAVNVSTLMTGSVISQIIPFLAAPVISRLYYPEDYALVAAYGSVTVLLTIVATGMYSSALMIDKTDEEAFNTGLAAFIITIAITAASFIILFFFNNAIASLTGNENINFWLYLIPLTVFFTGGYQTLNMWNNRKKRYKRLAANRIIQTVITTGATLVFGFLSYYSTGLMISLLLGQMFSFSLLLIQSIKSDGYLIKKSNYYGIKTSLKKHKDFPKYNMPQGFLDGLRESSIVFIISNYFGPVVLGSYSFAMTMLNKPLQLVGSSFNQVFYQKTTERYNCGKEISSITIKVVVSLMLGFFILSIPIIFWGKGVFLFFFGSNWEMSGQLSSILISWIITKFVLSTISSIPLTIGKQKFNFILSVFSNSLPPLFLFLFAYNGLKLFPTMIGFVVTNIILIIICFIWFLHIIKRDI
jgi:O-antigen/teichoic acid export membrane protein